MILSNEGIFRAVEEEEIDICPFGLDQIQPASYDLQLGSYLMSFSPYTRKGIVDPYENTDWMIEAKHEIGFDTEYVLHPRQLVLGHTNETVQIGKDLVARVDGKSSLGRLGLMVHITAGWIDPGFRGQVTLEIYNANSLPIKLWRGMPICQMSFMRLETPASIGYGEGPGRNRYQDQEGPTPSRYYLNSRLKEA